MTVMQPAMRVATQMFRGLDRQAVEALKAGEPADDAAAIGRRERLVPQLAGLDDIEGWAQEFECEFLDGSNVLLPYDVIALAESADASEFGPGQSYSFTFTKAGTFFYTCTIHTLMSGKVQVVAKA